MNNQVMKKWLNPKVTILSSTSLSAIAACETIIENLKAGNVVALDKNVVQTDCNTVEITLILNGQPKI